MYRVILVACSGLVLAACSSTPDWMPDTKMFSADAWSVNTGASMETVKLESTPPGAEVKASTGQSCRTPCALALPGDKAVSVNFTLNGYYPATEQIANVDMGDGSSALRPNPVLVELTPAPPPPKVTTPPRRRAAAKPKPKPAPKPAAPPPAAVQQSSSPWPAPTQR